MPQFEHRWYPPSILQILGPLRCSIWVDRQVSVIPKTNAADPISSSSRFTRNVCNFALEDVVVVEHCDHCRAAVERK
jgi:hypothetical protein